MQLINDAFKGDKYEPLKNMFSSHGYLSSEIEKAFIDTKAYIELEEITNNAIKNIGLGVSTKKEMDELINKIFKKLEENRLSR